MQSYNPAIMGCSFSRLYDNIHGTAISYRCAKFGAFVNSVTILTLRDLTIGRTRGGGC